MLVVGVGLGLGVSVRGRFIISARHLVRFRVWVMV